MVNGETARRSGASVTSLAIYNLIFPALTVGQEKEAPLSQDQTLQMLQAGVPSQKIEAVARQDGVDFKVTPELERELRKAGATERLIELLKKAGSQAAPAPPAAITPTDNAALLQKAQDALNRRDFAEAVNDLKSVVASQPGLPDVWFNLGYAYTALHQPEEAAKAFEKSLELAPNLFQAQLNLGILLMERTQPQDALPHLQKAAALQPDNARAHLYYARALAQTAQPEAALKELQEATRLDPHLPSAQFELGMLELQQKHPAEAAAAFQQSLLTDPHLVQAELGAALAAEGLNDAPQAAAHFEKYAASRPNDVEAQFHLGRLYLRQNQNQKARDALLRVDQAKPDTPGLAAALGEVNARLKNYPESEKYYRQALSTQPEGSGLHRALGEVLLDERKFTEAEGEFRTALRLNSHDRDAAIGLASCLDLQNRYQEAIPTLQLLAKAPDASPYVFFVLATCYDHLLARKEALAYYERFLQLANGKFPDQEWQATQRAKLLRRVLVK